MLTMRASPEVIAAIEKAASEAPGWPSRSEMVRRIVTTWLTEHGFPGKS